MVGVLFCGLIGWLGLLLVRLFSGLGVLVLFCDWYWFVLICSLVRLVAAV